MTTAAVIQARLGSTRFPQKVLAQFGDGTVLSSVIERAQAIATVDVVALVIPKGKDDDALQWWGEQLGVEVLRVQESQQHCPERNDLLLAYAKAARALKADVVLRITADCPLLDPVLAAEVAKPVQAGTHVFGSNCWPRRTFPDGLDVEAFTAEILAVGAAASTSPEEREHVTYWARKTVRPEFVANLVNGDDWSAVRWTIDTMEDLRRLRRVAHHLPMRPTYTWAETRAAAEAAGVWP